MWQKRLPHALAERFSGADLTWTQKTVPKMSIYKNVYRFKEEELILKDFFKAQTTAWV